MTEKRFTHKKWYDERQLFDGEEAFAIVDSGTQASIICNRLNKLSDENDQLKQSFDIIDKVRRELIEENEQLKEDVEYWKQVASQYSNELNVFEHCKKYKTECKDIHWSSE